MTDICEKSGITVVNTDFQHNDMRDTGPDTAKSTIQGMLDKFLDDTDNSAVGAGADQSAGFLTDAPGPVAMYKPTTAN